jgi:hypothetical protein
MACGGQPSYLIIFALVCKIKLLAENSSMHQLFAICR